MTQTLYEVSVNSGAFEALEAMLAAENLPADDIRQPGRHFFVYGDNIEGFGGLEVYGTQGLLRSVVIASSRRGAGVGTALIAALEDEAHKRGIETLWLLTTSAADFFIKQGYLPTERSQAPKDIAASQEFAELCPSTATCMRKALMWRPAT
jgi:amino-acid N-acetyltransferase